MTSLLRSLKLTIAMFLVLFGSTAQAQYCTPVFFQGCVFGSQINTFNLAGASSTAINDPSTGCASGNYQDSHLTMSVTLNQGGSYTIMANTSIASLGVDYIQVWIDFNNDNSFSSAESVGGGGPMSGTLGSYPITIPATAALGSHRMRAVVSGQLVYPSLNACPTFIADVWGEVHDYTAVIAGSTTACSPVTGLAASAITSSSATISWTAVTGAVGYEWAVTTSSTPPASGTPTTTTTANATGLTASTSYYAHVRTNCGTTYSAWTTIPFTTAATTTCPPVTGLAASSITASSATISWTAATGATGYEWAVTTSSTPPASGTATTLTTANATGLTAATNYYAHVRTNCGTGFSTWTTIPFTTLSTGGCAPVSGLTATGITTSAATLNWTAVTGATGYEWSVTTSSTPPASGTATTLTTANATGLTASTAYYAHVRTNCGTSFSAWTTIPFTTAGTTTGCTAISGLSASAITTSSATVSWTAITSGSLGYQYVIDNTVTDPVGSGTNTTATSTSPTGLSSGTTYYAHVRDSCGVGNFSAWNTIPFTTLSTTGCNAVTSLTASAITATSATISWTPATGAIGARYVVNTMAPDPVSGGTGTTATSANITGLTSNTLYYAHVRDSCSATSLSAWVTIPLRTAKLNVNNVVADAPIVTAFPNPTDGVLTVKIAGAIAGKATLQLTDIAGKTLLTTAASDINVISLSDLPSGIYLVRYSDDLHREVLKVSKQ